MSRSRSAVHAANAVADEIDLLCFPFFSTINISVDKSFNEFVDRLSTIARLVNTVKMQSDLMNDHDMHFKVGELLNVGKIEVDALKRINTLRIKELILAINKTEENFDNVDAELKKLQMWELVRKVTEDLGEASSFPSTHDFLFKDIESLDTEFSAEPFGNAESSVENVLNSLEDLKGYSTLGFTREEEVNRYFQQFVSVKEAFANVISYIDPLITQIEKMTPFKSWDLEQKRSVISEPERLISAIIWRKGVQEKGDTSDYDKNALDKNFGLLDDLKQSVKIFEDDYTFFENTLFKHAYNSLSDLSGFEAIDKLAAEIGTKKLNKIFKIIESDKKLMKGLEPILEIKKTKFMNSSFSSDLGTKFAIEKVNLILKEMIKTITTVKGFGQYLTNFEHCGAKGKSIDDSKLSGARFSLHTGQEMIANFEDFWKRDFFHHNLRPLLADLGNANRTLENINPNERTHSMKQLSNVFSELTINGTLNVIQKSMKTLLTTLKTFNSKQLDEAFSIFKNRREQIEGFLKISNVTYERNVHICLNSYQHQCKTSYEATLLIRMIRLLEVESINNVSRYMDQVAKVQRTLDSLKSILPLVKNNSNAYVEKLNKIDKLVVTRIEKAVNSVNNLVSLKKQGLLKELKAIQSRAEDEINLIAVFGPRDPIYKDTKSSWNLKEAIMSLETSLDYFDEHVKEFNFQKVRNLSNYDSFFESMKDMPQIAIKPESLIRVLNYLIKTTTWENHIPVFTKTKEKLIEISSMDLDFAKHFREVGDAFQKLENFLIQSLTDDVVDPMQDDQDIQKEDEIDYTWIIVGCVVFIACLSGGAIFILWKKKLLCFKRKRESVDCEVIDLDPVDNKPVLPPHLIIVAIGMQTFGRHPEHYELWIQLMEHVKTSPTPENRQFPYLPLMESKYFDPKIRLNPYTALQSVRLHGNKFRTRLGTVFYAMQAPMEANNMHDDTRADFLAMILIDNVEFIVFLGETSSCGQYFVERAGNLTVENFTVTTEGEQQFQNSADIVVRTLMVKDNKKKTQRKVKQFQVKHWNEGDIPNCGHQPLEAIMTEICKSKSPVVVHCTSGTGRTMSFIGMEYISRLLEANEEMTFTDAFKKLVEKRYSAFENVRQIGWLQVGTVYFMAIRHNAEPVWYDNILGMFREMVERNVGVPRGVKF
ncbi:hypothetical protein CRE_21478 [Caenorhabditis remanei]|uniref:Tyrosine-protein phosphatase domain-containing protein n=1 Tax=Caenorhabditis remanei TaxID=31234 RepID=E3N8X3_CAERE|nr:hypothetical protein CRE_21478 [Caenorhabditis remanei]